MRPWADVGIARALWRESFRRGVGAGLAGASGLSAGTLLGAPLQMRGLRGASGSLEVGGVAAGTLDASTGDPCGLGVKSASAACRAVRTCARSGKGGVYCRSSGNVALRIGDGHLNIGRTQRYCYSPLFAWRGATAKRGRAECTIVRNSVLPTNGNGLAVADR